MKKSLIALAALACTVACAQQAKPDVNVYGLIDLGYGRNLSDALAGNPPALHSGGDDFSTQGNSTSKFGLRGSQALSPDVKVNFQLESNGIQSDGSINAPFFNRKAWLGFSGSFGEVRLGKQDSVVIQTLVGYDVNGAANTTSAQANVGGLTVAPSRDARSLQYLSPDYAGMTFQLGYTAPAPSLPVPDGAVAYASYGLRYTKGPFSVGVAGEEKRYEYSSDLHAIAGSYDLGALKLMLGYADGGGGYTSGSKTYGGNRGYVVGASAPLGKFELGMDYAKNPEIGAEALEMYLHRELFKNATAYLDLGARDLQGQRNDYYAMGVTYSF